jgi:hypothetical protein
MWSCAAVCSKFFNCSVWPKGLKLSESIVAQHWKNEIGILGQSCITLKHNSAKLTRLVRTSFKMAVRSGFSTVLVSNWKRV